jgi:lysophospholipase L1-like esterase
MRAYIDGVEVASAAATGLNAITINNLALGSLGNVDSWPGDIAYASLYSQAQNVADIRIVFTSLQSSMAARGVTLSGLSALVVFDGDSITDPAQLDAETMYPWLALSQLSPVRQGRNYAIVNSRVANLTSRAATVDANYNSSRSKNILFVFVGSNDQTEAGATANSVYTNLKTYCLARRAVGWTVVVATILPRTDVSNVTRNALNTLIRNDTSFYSALADFGADATMGCDNCYSNLTYFNADGIHPIAAGHAIIAPIASAAIASVL